MAVASRDVACGVELRDVNASVSCQTDASDSDVAALSGGCCCLVAPPLYL